MPTFGEELLGPSFRISHGGCRRTRPVVLEMGRGPPRGASGRRKTSSGITPIRSLTSMESERMVVSRESATVPRGGRWETGPLRMRIVVVFQRPVRTEEPKMSPFGHGEGNTPSRGAFPRPSVRKTLTRPLTSINEP